MSLQCTNSFGHLSLWVANAMALVENDTLYTLINGFQAWEM